MRIIHIRMMILKQLKNAVKSAKNAVSGTGVHLPPPHLLESLQSVIEAV
jgi:hypothetical protein